MNLEITLEASKVLDLMWKDHHHLPVTLCRSLNMRLKRPFLLIFAVYADDATALNLC